MLDDENSGFIYDFLGDQTRGLLEGDNHLKTDPGWIPVDTSSQEQKQVSLFNAAPNLPQVDIFKAKKPAHYKMFSGSKGKYMYSERCVPVQVGIINLRPGLELSVALKYEALTHQHEAVQACDEHFNLTPAESKGMDLRTPNKAAFALMAGYSRLVQYELEGLHPMARVTLNADAEKDVMNLVFPCYSSCKPHKNCGNLMLLHLSIRDINTRTVVSTSVFTVRVAANVRARATMKYEEDMLGITAPRRPAKRPMPDHDGEGLTNTANVDVVAKYLKREHGNDSELIQNVEEPDNTSGVVGIVMDHSKVNFDGNGCDDSPDTVKAADLVNSLDCFTKEEWDIMAIIGADVSSSALATDDNASMRDGTGSASHPIPLLEASCSTNHSIGFGAASGMSLDFMACTDDVPVQMEYNQTLMVSDVNTSAVTVANQNQTPPEGYSLTSSTSLDFCNNPPVSRQEYTVSNDVVLLVEGIKNPEIDYHKIQEFIESLGASCSQTPVLNLVLD